jgi:hypothetical protein
MCIQLSEIYKAPRIYPSCQLQLLRFVVLTTNLYQILALSRCNGEQDSIHG